MNDCNDITRAEYQQAKRMPIVGPAATAAELLVWIALCLCAFLTLCISVLMST